MFVLVAMEADFGCLPLVLHLTFGQGSLLNQEQTVLLERPAQESFPPHHQPFSTSSTRVTDTYAWLYLWVLGIQTQVFMPAQHTLYLLNCCLGPMFYVFIDI